MTPATTLSTTFGGFSPQATTFLSDLAANNNKAWFEAHRQTYLDQVQTPALDLVVTLGERLQARFREIVYDTRTNGGGSLMRLHRDTRFSADKSPYKTNVAMIFTPGGKKMEQPGFGLQLTPTGVDVMAGMFAFSKSQLEAYRAAVLSAEHGRALEQAAHAVAHAGEQTGEQPGEQPGDYRIEGIGYKRVPKGYDADHPRAEWLKFTGLHAFAPPVPLEIAYTPELADVIERHFIHMSPIYEWLTRVFGAN